MQGRTGSKRYNLTMSALRRPFSFRRLLLSTLLLTGAWAQDRPELNGVWQLDPAHCAFSEIRLKSQTVSIKQEDESIKVEDTATEESGKERKAEFEDRKSVV